MDNPLIGIRFQVPFDAVKPEHLRPATDALITRSQAALDALAGDPGPRTYDNTLGALERATKELEFAITIAGHLESVAMTDAYRDAYNEIQPDVSAFFSSIVLQEGIWKALQDYAETPEAGTLDPIRKRFLTKTVDSFRQHGAELDPAGKARLQALNVRLAEITTRFGQNVLDATNAFELVITDEARLAGLPESARQAARASAEAKGVEGYRFTLQGPSYIAVIRYMDDPEIREKVWRAYNTRASTGEWDNREIITEVLALRKEKAELLGFRDFSDLVLHDRMARTGSAASEFLDEIRSKTKPFFARETTELRAFKKRHTGDDSLHAWDVGYWSEREQRELYDFDEEELRPYFSVDQVMNGVFRTVQNLYGVEIERTEGPTWHPSVRLYRLLENGQHLGTFYADLFPRETKRGGAWMNSFIVAVPPEPHLGLICANATPAVGDKPALLTHREVETIFHEFGHLMHHLLSRVPVRSLAGTSVAWDFVELPSQIMENWCWEREALDTFAKHHETGAVIPGELFAKLKRARTYGAASMQMRQLGFGTADLALHRDYDPKKHGDVLGYARKIFQEHSTTDLTDDYGMIASFTHLFSSPVAYAAGYYSYKWAEVLDADAFTRFQKEGVFNREVGQSFRDEILSRGDSDEPATLFENFMGRPPNSDALMKRQGLV